MFLIFLIICRKTNKIHHPYELVIIFQCFGTSWILLEVCNWRQAFCKSGQLECSGLVMSKSVWKKNVFQNSLFAVVSAQINFVQLIHKSIDQWTHVCCVCKNLCTYKDNEWAWAGQIIHLMINILNVPIDLVLEDRAGCPEKVDIDLEMPVIMFAACSIRMLCIPVTDEDAPGHLTLMTLMMLRLQCLMLCINFFFLGWGNNAFKPQMRKPWMCPVIWLWWPYQAAVSAKMC